MIDGIKFYYESDGDPTRKTYYVIAEHPTWSDNQRLDFDNARDARSAASDLRAGTINMEQAAARAQDKWR